MRRRFQSRKVRLLVAFVAALCLAGGALAYWTASGSGTAQATVTNPSPLTITAGSTPSTPLFPGTDGDVTAHIENPNPFPVHIGTLSRDTSQGTSLSGFSGPAGCDPPPLTFTAQTNGGVGWTVPKKVGSVNGVLDLDPAHSSTLVNAVHMSISAANACQGGTFTVYLQTGP